MRRLGGVIPDAGVAKMRMRRAVLLAGAALGLGCGGGAGGADAGQGSVDAGVDASACATQLGRVAASEGGGDHVAIASSGSGYGVFWPDLRHGEAEIYFVQLDDAGHRVGEDVRLTNAAGASLAPAIVWNGTDFGVAWSDDRDGAAPEIYFVRASANGPIAGTEHRVSNAAMPSLGVSIAASTGSPGTTSATSIPRSISPGSMPRASRSARTSG